MTSIDKDTSLYCSFAKRAGSKGCIFHNAGFQRHGINAIYKSFSIQNIEYAINAIRTLNIKGAGITMPFKIDALDYLDILDGDVEKIGSCNTIVNNSGVLKGYNTDYLAVKDHLKKIIGIKHLTILGTGGYSKAVQHACQSLNIHINIISRDNWNDINKLQHTTVFNCTPVENIDLNKSVHFIDCNVTTETGKDLATRQAKYQFKLYTGVDYDIS